MTSQVLGFLIYKIRHKKPKNHYAFQDKQTDYIFEIIKNTYFELLPNRSWNLSWLYAKGLVYITSFSFPNNSWKWVLLTPFYKWESATERSWVTFPSSHSDWSAEPGLFFCLGSHLLPRETQHKSILTLSPTGSEHFGEVPCFTFQEIGLDLWYKQNHIIVTHLTTIFRDGLKLPLGRSRLS